jgi:hypothetical protein
MNPRIYVVFFIALAHGVKWSVDAAGSPCALSRSTRNRTMGNDKLAAMVMLK